MSVKEKNPCYHCGEESGKHPVIYDEKPFCCTGCSTVYEILKDSDACEYYTIEDKPGIKADIAEIGNKYAYLDHEEIIAEILDFYDGGIGKVKLFIPSIHCSSCIWLLENLHRLHKGIRQSMVNFVKKEVSITFKQDEISLRELVELLVSISYVPQISLDDIKEKGKGKKDKKIYYQLGVAGFCFGNIMLLSFPDYLAIDHIIEERYRQSFAYINLGLSLPVMFYAATDYLISAYKSLRKKVINIDFPISLGILTLFIRSAYDILTATGAGYMDSLAGLVFFLLIGKWYQSKTYEALSFERDYKSYFPVAVTTIDEDGNETSIPLKRLKPGDRIIIRNQELIPADALLLKGDANIDYSFVSGESTPVHKELKQRIFAGGRQIGSSLELVVEKEVEQSYLTELWNQGFLSSDRESRLNSIINKVSQYFTIIIVLIATISSGIWMFVDPSLAMNVFTSVLIIACPCALALTIPFTFGSTMRFLGRSGFYLKKTEVIEQLSKINTIVFDKTGTLTQNDAFEIDSGDMILSEEELIWVKSAVKHSTHPMSVAIFKSLNNIKAIETASFEEIPAKGIKAVFEKGELKLGSSSFVTGSEPKENEIYTRVFVGINNEQKGSFKIRNKYREGFDDVIHNLESYDLHLLSGDNEAELPKLLPYFKNAEKLHFKQSPKDKLHYIQNLQQKEGKVLMIGDGLNDAGALNESEVGVSIADDIYHFSPACDAILEADKFKYLNRFIRFTHTSMNIVKISFVISFAYNLTGMYFAVMGYLSPVISAILMPISSVTVVAFVTFATALMAKRKKIIL